MHLHLICGALICLDIVSPLLDYKLHKGRDFVVSVLYFQQQAPRRLLVNVCWMNEWIGIYKQFCAVDHFLQLGSWASLGTHACPSPTPLLCVDPASPTSSQWYATGGNPAVQCPPLSPTLMIGEGSQNTHGVGWELECILFFCYPVTELKLAVKNYFH